MKYLIVFLLFASQMSSAQIGTSGGFQTPLQMSTSTISAVFKAAKNDPGLMLWSIKTVSVNDNLVKVEFLKEDKTCAALLYEVKVNAREEYKASLVTDALVQCSK